AGGSIGSELVRQILLMEPKKVLLLDQSELNLFEIENELRASGYTGIYFPILSDLKEKKILQKLFADHEPQIVFHAAAYKHVHLVENNGDAAILNNLLSTQLLLDCSLENKVSHFVMISSDKAVNPQGIMGSTKRACELMVAEAGEVSGRHYCSVRFGNVLGSSGSLIPLLTKQIDRGGPVTITHQDMERYFMLIPEAVSLVLKATSLAQPGEIHILKMGNSIKIRDIVQSLILLMGKTLDSIPVIYTGIRPGEKMKEELY
ncbi:MAG: polysaccharide biosynthesis protein, partial [Pseudobdellovibrionaceae bacterium]